MDIIIQSLGFTAGKELEDFVREKIGKLDKLAKIVRANVTLFLGPQNSGDRYYCEVRLEIPGNDLFVKRNEDSFEKVTVTVTDTLQQTLRRTRDKLVERQQSGLPPERSDEIIDQQS